MRSLWLVPLLAVAGCATAPAVGRARFANQPPVGTVVDRVDLAGAPEGRPFPQKLYFFDAYLYGRVAHYLDVPSPRRALDVNAVDEVPDSSWFVNRVAALSPDDVRHGPNEFDGPAQGWRIISSKTGGGSAGFVVEDTRGDRYIIKFDEPQAPVTESATDVAVQRLMWALGYHVPENSIVYFDRADLKLDDKAKVKDLFGNARPMTWDDVDGQLARSYRRPDGSYRALASKFLPGKPLGGFAQTGVRGDDPNDTIPHQHRRSVRALYLIFGWLQQTDAKEDNTLDVLVDEGGHHHVRHYLVDFGKSFGTSASVALRPGDGHVENVDLGYTLGGLLSFGLWTRPYEGTRFPGIQGVGMFDGDHFDPARWKSHAPYAPFRQVDAADLFWAARQMAQLTPAHLRAALEAGRWEDPRAVDYLLEALLARQHRAITWAYQQVAPLDRVGVDRGRLCFDDLLIAQGYAVGIAGATTYRAQAFGYDGRAQAWAASTRPDATGHACLDGVVAGPDHDGYVIVRIATSRGAQALPTLEVHLARGADQQLRVIGLERR